MRRALLVWVGLGVLGSAEFVACLPEVTVDETLGTETGALNGGSGGAAGKTPSSAGTGGAAGSDTSAAGSGGAAGTAGETPPSGTAMGGAAGTDGETTASSSGAGGMAGTAGAPAEEAPAAGAGGMSAAGAGGAGGDACPAGLTREQACNAYCALYTEACSDFPLAYDYQGPADCSLFCYDSDWEIGTISQPNSIMCRCNHSNLALLRGQNPHCFHAARVPSLTGGCEIPAP